MKLTLKQIADAQMAIKSVESEKGSAKWSYGLTKNEGLIATDFRAIATAEKAFEEVNRKRLDYCEEHATKDSSRKPIIENGVYKGIDSKDPELVDLVEKLRVLDAEFGKLLETEVDIELHIIPFSEVPEKIAPADFRRLKIFIADPK